MNQPLPSFPWWRVPALWLVLGGPALAVLAGTAAAVLAFRGSDPVVHTAQVARLHTARALSAAPAQQVRNHAATVPDAR